MSGFTLHHQSPLGILTLTASEDLLHSLEFERDEVYRVPSKPNALLIEAGRQLEEYFAGERKIFDLPMEQEGSPFQQKVWLLLQEIPFGRTVSYSTLAKRYGDVKAIRAIATANGKNHLPLIVPCHRVIGADQSLTGFSGGLWRKKWLLEHEAKLHSGLQQLF